MLEIILILKILGMAWVITKFEPIQWVLEILQSKIKPNNITLNLILNIIITITTCFSCCSMWCGFILGGFWYGILCYIISFVYSKKLSLWEYKMFNPNYGEEN